LGVHNDALQNEHSYSLFGSLTWNVSDRLKLSGGLRGSWVDKNYRSNAFTGTTGQTFGGIVPQPAFFGPPTSLSGDRTDHAWMPSAKVQYQIEPRAMAYFSYSRGFKEGGFNGLNPTNNPADVPYGPEHVNAYELGVKSEWFADTVLLNLDVFRSDYTGLQSIVEVINAECPQGCNLIRNAASSVAQGVELETQWAVSNDFRLSVNASYVDAHYGSYPNGPATDLQTLLTGKNFTDDSGERIGGTPKWSGSVNATYSKSLPGDYKFTSELSPYFSSSYYRDPFAQWRGGYVRLDARLSLEKSDGRWALDLIGRNLTDRIIVVGGSVDGTGTTATIVQISKETPRNVAIQARFRW
jgi:outer membrane receptor protein involved in Fe transport